MQPRSPRAARRGVLLAWFVGTDVIMTRTITPLALVVALAACGFGPTASGSLGLLGLGDGGEIGDAGRRDDGGDDGGVGDDGGDFDRDDCKIEDESVGRTDVTIQLAGSTVRVASWTEKADSPRELVGFTLAVAGDDLVFTVKAGGEVYDASGDSWAHPRGDRGPDVSAISHIDFCDNGMPDGGDDGNDPGDDTGDDTGDDGDSGAECPPGTEGCAGGDGDSDDGTGSGDAGGDDPTCAGEVCG